MPAENVAERAPVEALAAPGDERDRGDEEEEVEQELDEPLPHWSSASVVLEVEEPEQVDEQEGHEEREGRRRQAREATVPALQTGGSRRRRGTAP